MTIGTSTWGGLQRPRVFDSYHGYAPANPQDFSPCPPITLPPGGTIQIDNTNHIITLHSFATYRPNCTYISAHNDPFCASTTVFIFVVGTTTTIAWMLFILLLITQRSSRSSNTPKTTGWLQAHGVSGAIAGRTPLGGLGNRPWLQKAAAFLVAVGLTVACVDTFSNAKIQHDSGWNSARWMRDAVVRTYEIRILRLVSGIFVWLALVQTLLRLFPRRKEKLIIKWIGFALILLDTVFSSLNMFWLNNRSLPGSYQDAISALAYLFQLSINLLYAAWVIYYVVTQRRFAFFRPDQLNMSIVALLAMISITIPVAFFISDMSVPPAAAWGDFFRWVGGGAASVVVWEWVERIEALEREEKRDGILGREVFDEDELSTSGKSAYRSPSFDTSSGNSGGSSSSSDGISTEKAKAYQKMSFGGFTRRLGRRHYPRAPHTTQNNPPDTYLTDVEKQQDNEAAELAERLGSQLSASEAPSSRHSVPSVHGRASPGSTIYAVHYHPGQPTPAVQDSNGPEAPDGTNADQNSNQPNNASSQNHQVSDAGGDAHLTPNKSPTRPHTAKLTSKSRAGWNVAMSAFKRRKRSPPLEIKKAMQRTGSSAGQRQSNPQRINFKSRLYPFGSGRGDSANGNDASSEGMSHQANQPHQPTIIPAPPRGQTWSPDILRHSPVHLLPTSTQGLIGSSHAHPGLAYRRTAVENAEASAAAQQDPHGRPQATAGPANDQAADAGGIPETPTHHQIEGVAPEVEAVPNAPPGEDRPDLP